MPELNKANREVCDVDIRILSTMAPFLKFDTANTTTTGLSSDSVHAMAKGSRRIAFANPLEGTMTIEAQVYPFKLFSLLSDGTIESSAAYADSKIVTCSEAGKLNIDVVGGKMIKPGTIFVYPEGEYGDDDSLIKGTYADNIFTATEENQITAGSNYEVAYIVIDTSVKKITFNNKKLPKDYYITQKTVEKDEDGWLTPFIITAYKATIQRTFELSFSSEGEPASVTLTFDLMEDKDGNVIDMVELTSDVVA